MTSSAGETPGPSGRRSRPELSARRTTVVAIEELGPVLRRITLGGDDLVDFPWTRLGCADHVKIVLPSADGELRLPERGVDRRARPDAVRPEIRDYTVRRVDPAVGTVTLDFAVHEHGPAGRWAAEATVGAALGVLGPRGSHAFPGHFADYLIGGDLTAFPALCRWIEELPAAAGVTVLTEGADPPLPQRDGLLVRSVPPGSSIAELLGEVAIDPASTFAWFAGEANRMREVRRVLLASGLPRQQVDVDGYWREGSLNAEGRPID